MDVENPQQIGDILRKLFIIRPDGSVDHDMVVTHAQMAKLYENERNKQCSQCCCRGPHPRG